MSSKLKLKGRFYHKAKPSFIYNYEITDRFVVTWNNTGTHYDLSTGHRCFRDGIWVLKHEFKDYLKAIEE